MAEAVGKATGRPGICFVTRGPGRHQCLARHPYRDAGFDADDRVRRPGRARHARARSVPGTRLPRRVRHHGQMGDRDRRSGAHSGNRVARLPCRDQWAARTGGDRAAGGHADRARRSSPMRPAFEPIETWPGLTDMSQTTEDALGRATADHDPRRQPLVGQSLGRHAALRRALRPCRSSRPSGAGICSIRLHPNYAGDLGIGPNPKLLARVKAADLVLLVGARHGRDAEPELYAVRHSGSRSRPSCMSIPARTNSAASIVRIWRSTRRRRPSPRRSKACRRRTTIPWSDETRTAHADYLAYTETATARAGRGQSRRDHGLAARAIFTGRHPLQRRRQFLRLAASLLSLAPIQHASSARPPARWATACRPRSR